MKFKFISKENINSLPSQTGIYSFIDKNKEIFYIGKAANIKIRVKNHFQQPSFRDDLYIEKIEKIGFIITESEIEALILESQLIKKRKPKYNVLWKDDKNYFYVAVTQELLPRVFITHQQDNLKLMPKNSSALDEVGENQNAKVKMQKSKISKIKYFGPFVDGKSLKKTLSILRQIFPYYTTSKHSQKPCPWCHLNLCPGPPQSLNIQPYKKDIKNLSLFLQSKKRSLIKKLKLEMAQHSLAKNFEKAARTRDQLTSLEKTLLNARIFATSPLKEKESLDWSNIKKRLRNILEINNQIYRIETYDISNIQGKLAVGSMAVFIDGKPEKSLYRKFRIRMENEPNDTAMLKEVLQRRLNHEEWPLPQIMLIDGGKGQLNAALEIKKQNLKAKNIKIISLAKRNNELFIEEKKHPLLLKDLLEDISNLILRCRDEAHRFAITYHRKLRIKALTK